MVPLVESKEPALEVSSVGKPVAPKDYAMCFSELIQQSMIARDAIQGITSRMTTLADGSVSLIRDARAATEPDPKKLAIESFKIQLLSVARGAVLLARDNNNMLINLRMIKVMKHQRI